jgi:phosphate ABC transporter phosphate-binding protein
MAAGVLAAGLTAGTVLHGTAARAAEFVAVTGAGSTWSQNALTQWQAHVKQSGITINYDGQGSTAGRNRFTNLTADFAVSEIPYGVTDQGSNVADPPPVRKFAYMPVVAGGTAFMYNLKVGGRKVTNLRLSGPTIAKIFTGAVTLWNDPVIKAENPGIGLPARKIVPVYRSDGSGTTAQFTAWLAARHQGIWDPYCASVGRRTPCGQTSVFPGRQGFVGQNGSSGVTNYTKANTSEGAITYVEYSYAREARFPVVKVLNEQGYYVEPTAKNVAVALLEAKIDESNPGTQTYLTQDLSGVYRSADKRAYPLSSYSYAIVPTALEPPMNENKGYTLAKFLYYVVCQGQEQAETLGYSPLPINLVRAGYSQIKRIPGRVEEQMVGCRNPTFAPDGSNRNILAETAPNPPECDKAGGATQCTTGTGGAADTTNPAGGGTTSGGAATAGAATPGADGSAASSAPPVIDPDTGEVVGGGGGGGGQPVYATPVDLAGSGGWTFTHTMMALAGVLLAGLIVIPPLVARAVNGRGDDRGAR